MGLKRSYLLNDSIFVMRIMTVMTINMTRLTLRAAEFIVVHVFVFARRTLDTVVGRTPFTATRAVDTL